MSTPLLKLYKGSYNSSELLQKCTEGAIVFDNSTHRIYAGTDSNKPVMFGSNIQDVVFTNSILKIWKVGDTATPSITLDFSDIASASGMMAVFQALYEKMGLTGDNHDQIDYSGTNYLSDLGTSGHSDKNLVNADKALDAAIKTVSNKVDDLDVTEYEQGVVDTTTSETETTVKIKSIKEVDGKIEAGTSTTDIKLDGTYNPSTNKVATQSTVTNAVKKAANSSATYDTTASEISQSWIGVVNANKIKQGDTFEEDIDKLDTKIAGLADELIKDEQVTQQAITSIANSVGLENNLSLDLSDANLNIIKNDTSVKKALVDLDAAFAEAGKVDDVKINDTSIVDANKNANIAVDGTYDATNNKIATESTVSGAINKLDVTTDKGGASVSGSTITITGVQQEDGLIKNGGSTTINLDGTYDATDNKIATKSTVTTAIEALDGSATIASKSGNVVTIKTGVTEADGVISNDSGTDIVLEEVAVTGAAADVSIADTEGKITATTVEGALTELAKSIEALQGAFDVVVSTDAATTPQGVSWGSVVGTLVASADTFHKIYLVPAGGTTPNTYSEYITTRTGAKGSYTYGWEKLGDIAVDLTGYVKTITVNGKVYAVDSNSTNISLGDVITSIVGETAIAGGDADVVSVEATTAKDSTNGTNVTTLASKVKIEEVADGIVKDNTPVYEAGHYVIENGKLVSAAGKSSGATYTISANDGLVKASDVKAYVDSSIADSGFRWSEWS